MPSIPTSSNYDLNGVTNVVPLTMVRLINAQLIGQLILLKNDTLQIIQ